MRVTLYTTLGCHLCEDALNLLRDLQATHPEFTIHQVEISESELLLALYGVRIPVVATGHREGDLGWPFTQADLVRFLLN